MSLLKKIPVVGWLVGLIALLFFVLIIVAKRLWLAQARLRVESSLRHAGKQRETAIKHILEGHRQRGHELQVLAVQREKFYAKERTRIVVEATKVGGLANAVDKAFGRNR